MRARTQNAASTGEGSSEPHVSEHRRREALSECHCTLNVRGFSSAHSQAKALSAMSFRDTAGVKPADCCTVIDCSLSKLHEGGCSTVACDKILSYRTRPLANPTSYTTGDRGPTEGAQLKEEAVAAAETPHFPAAQEQSLSRHDAEAAMDDAYSDAASVRNTSRKAGSSGYGSARSSTVGAGQLSSRILYSSAPITFTKALSGEQQWGAYARTRRGYLNAETVRAAAAADESAARGQIAAQPMQNRPMTADHEERVGNKEELTRQQEGKWDSEQIRAACGPPKAFSTPGRYALNDNVRDFANQRARSETADNAPMCVALGERRECTSSGLRSSGQKAFLENWKLGRGETTTELERLLKEESELAEAAAARSELEKRELLQEDMEAMIDNLQQVWGSGHT